MKLRELVTKIFHFGKTDRQFSLGDQSWTRPAIPSEPRESLDKALAKNRARLEEIFVVPTNMDVIIREFRIPSVNKNALIIYVDGLVDRVIINFAILQPLMILDQEVFSTGNPMANVFEKLLPGHQIIKSKELTEAVNGVLDGSTVLLIDGSNEALIIETKGWEHRAVEQPLTEHVVRGPQEGFNETFRDNTAAVRRYLKDPKLVSEIFRVGKRSGLGSRSCTLKILPTLNWLRK